MANTYPKCEICDLRHAPGNCKGEGGRLPLGAVQGNPLQSIAIVASDLTRLLGDRGVTVFQDPFSLRAETIARQAILRADVHGMKNYGPAPAPLDEKRDMFREAIEELLDAIYYLTRQVARLEDLREKLTGGGKA